VLAVVGVAFAGWYLPGLVRALLLVGAGVGLGRLWRYLNGPVGAAARPFAAGVVGWLLVAWWKGLFDPASGIGLLALIALGVQRWVAYRLREEVTAVVEAEASPPTPPPAPAVESTAVERLADLLWEAPLSGHPFKHYVVEMEEFMSENTVRKYLEVLAATRPSHGRFRASSTTPRRPEER